jgi:TPR repeat
MSWTMRTQLPLGIDPKRYFLCLLGPLTLGLSVGIQITITALLFIGPASSMDLAVQLTEHGQKVFHPEHDMVIYAAGAAFTLFMVWVTVWYWRAKLAGTEAARAPEFMTAAALLEALLAASSMIVYVFLLCSGWFSRNFQTAPSSLRPPTSQTDALRMLVPCAVALICAAFELKYGLGHSAKSASQLELWRLRLGRILRYATPLFIILVLGVPPAAWGYLAGQFLEIDMCHHLSFFMMGPAIAFSHGKAFGTEIYSQYGIGWPLLGSALSHFSALTFGNLIGMEIVYGCVYYVALFFLLRSCFQQEVWAAFAVILALCWQIFSGLGAGEVIWAYPSSTMMRHPLDVWFFLALLRHQRCGKTFWAALAGVTGALGVFFETETGIYLLVTFLIYSVLQGGLAMGRGRLTDSKAFVRPLVVFYSAAAATLLPLLLYASRGTLFTPAFWRGWVEALVKYGSWGASALPIAQVPDAALVSFLTMFTIYLGVIAYALLRVLHGSASQGEVLLATLAAYGVALLLLFVNRSHPFNLCHATPPFAVVLTALLFRGRKALAGLLRYSSLPYGLTLALEALLLTKGLFLSYPSILSSLFSKQPRSNLALMSKPRDLAGLPPKLGTFVNGFNQVADAIRTLAPHGKGVAVLDLDDTLYYYAANARPWFRYSPLFDMVLTKQVLKDIQNSLAEAPPKYVVTVAQSAKRLPDWDFVWAPLYEVVTNRFVLCQTVWPFEIWAQPESAMVHWQFAEDARAKGQVAQAIAQYTEALRLEPDFPYALNNLAWIRAAHSERRFRDGAEAVRLAEHACRVTAYKQPALLGTLAVAYAEAGRFDEAAAMAGKARALALAAGQNDMVDRCQRLLEWFKARHPYHETAAAPGRN